MFCYYLGENAQGSMSLPEHVYSLAVNGSIIVIKSHQEKMKVIRINGYVIEGALLVDDPDVKQAFTDAAGQLRHVRSFSQPGKLKSYVCRHPEGIIIAGVGAFFFIEPVPVSSAMIRFDEAGNADIQVRDNAESVEKQLSVMEAIRTAAEDELAHIR